MPLPASEVPVEAAPYVPPLDPLPLPVDESRPLRAASGLTSPERRDATDWAWELPAPEVDEMANDVLGADDEDEETDEDPSDEPLLLRVE